MEVAFCLLNPLVSSETKQREGEVPGTLGFLFAGGAEPIHCPLRTTYCSEAVCIATRKGSGGFRIMNLDRIHDSSIEGNQQDRCLTLEMPSSLGATGSLIFSAKEAKNFPPHILMIDSNDISDNFNKLSRW